MSRVKTIQDIETESEKIIIRKKEFEDELENAKKIMKNMKDRIVREAVNSRTNKEKFEAAFESFQKLKTDYEKLKAKLAENERHIDLLKKTPNVDMKGKYISHNDAFDDKSIAVLVDKYFNDNGKKEVDDLKKSLQY